MRPLRSALIHVSILLALAGTAFAARPNVLLLIADDLRPQLGAYGDTLAKTPNLDRFAQTALRFDRAYVQQAVCSPSRNSFLSGLRPSTTGLRGFGRTLRSAVPDVVTLPQHFKQHGYHAEAMGKIFHVYAETGLGSEDDPQSWSVPAWLPTKAPWGPQQETLRQQEITAARAAGKEFQHSHDWPRGEVLDAPEVADEELRDGETAARAANFLLARGKSPEPQPFFLAVGFYQPHLPFVAPKKYFDLYDAATLPLPDETPPRGAPARTFNPGMTTDYARFPAPAQRDAAFKRRYLQGYLASISYMDTCVGRVLDALERAGLGKDTLVVFLGDHGYFMGEYGSWGHKHANYEIATRAPLLVRAPGLKPGASSALVEFVDLYASLAELAGLPPPTRHEGFSFAPLLRDPTLPWKRAAFSEMPRGQLGIGRAIRTEHHRYIEWSDRSGAIVARELYDHRADPAECENISSADGSHTLITELSAQLRAGWPAALPREQKKP